jgi:hypothetical protein
MIGEAKGEVEDLRIMKRKECAHVYIVTVCVKNDFDMHAAKNVSSFGNRDARNTAGSQRRRPPATQSHLLDEVSPLHRHAHG